MLEIISTVSGNEYITYIFPIILIAIGLVSILTRTGLFELIAGFLLILGGVYILADPYVIINTSFLSNGTLLVAREQYFLHPYTEYGLILFGVLLWMLGYTDYRNS